MECCVWAERMRGRGLAREFIEVGFEFMKARSNCQVELMVCRAVAHHRGPLRPSSPDGTRIRFRCGSLRGEAKAGVQEFV